MRVLAAWAAVACGGCSLLEIGTPERVPLDAAIDAPPVDAIDAPPPIDAIDATPPPIDASTLGCTGLHVVFDNGHDVFVSSLDGLQRTPIAPHVATDVEVAGATLGRIAFTSNRDGNDEIYAGFADNTGVHDVTHDPGADTHPVLAHANPFLVYFRAGALTFIGVDGSGQLTLSAGAALTPAWSPADDRIAFAQRGPGFESDLWVVDRNGLNVRRLTTVPGSETAPSWSPDGLRIAFEKGGSLGTGFDVYVVNADGSGLTNLTSDATDQRAPAWSPDGATLAFIDDGRLVTMPAGGGPRTPLTTGMVTDFRPQWSPDGAQLLWLQLGSTTPELMIADADGSHQHGFTGPADETSSFAWVPCPDQ